ncbi:MAG TPA: alanyl-tRNA editing protein [Methylomirabilota bacterium]|nr:alanyl-tRNA editing protein [Methylomirabilota bacterium]
MSENLCYTDAYARETDAVVVELDPDANAVLLDRTVFYPGGGGQPADTGELVSDSGGTWRVTAAKKRGEEIWHTIEGELPAIDTRVVATLDWERRHQLMRTHSALYVLCGVVWRDHRASVTGGNMEPLSGRMDFEFETMSGELVGEIEQRVNEEVDADCEIRVSILPREEAFAIPDLVRTKINLLPEGISEVRTIEIVGLDLQADGGTHVASTGEIGRVKVTGYESKGRINKRIRIEVVDEGDR